MDSRKIESRINKEFLKFKAKVKSQFKPKIFLLFGSRAKKNAFIYSDFDFLIVSKAFKKMPWLERISKIARLWKAETNIDVLPYTLAEFEKKKRQKTIVQQAIKEGIAI